MQLKQCLMITYITEQEPRRDRNKFINQSSHLKLKEEEQIKPNADGKENNKDEYRNKSKSEK